MKSAASPRSFEPAPPQPPDGKTPPRPRSVKSDNPDSAAIEAKFGSTTPKEREEQHSAACVCGRRPERLAYVCEYCPRLAPEGRRIWRWLHGFSKVAT